MRISIQYEDQQVIVVYKPAGLATQTAAIGQADVVSELKNYLKGGYVGVVHRLDQPVEGLLVFGKTKEATAGLTKQLTEQILNKHYYAVICGKPAHAKNQLVDYLIKTKENRAQVSGAGNKEAKKAVLTYEIKESRTPVQDEDNLNVREISLADIVIETGRFHQIRAQMAHMGYALLGDQKYGDENALELSRRLKVRNVALCACGIAFRHPVSKKELSFEITPWGEIFAGFETFAL